MNPKSNKGLKQNSESREAFVNSFFEKRKTVIDESGDEVYILEPGDEIELDANQELELVKNPLIHEEFEIEESDDGRIYINPARSGSYEPTNAPETLPYPFNVPYHSITPDMILFSPRHSEETEAAKKRAAKKSLLTTEALLTAAENFEKANKNQADNIDTERLNQRVLLILKIVGFSVLLSIAAFGCFRVIQAYKTDLKIVDFLGANFTNDEVGDFRIRENPYENYSDFFNFPSSEFEKSAPIFYDINFPKEK